MKNITHQNLLNKAKAVFKGKFIALIAYFKEEKKAKINELSIHFKKLGK